MQLCCMPYYWWPDFLADIYVISSDRTMITARNERYARTDVEMSDVEFVMTESRASPGIDLGIRWLKVSHLSNVQ